MKIFLFENFKQIWEYELPTGEKKLAVMRVRPCGSSSIFKALRNLPCPEGEELIIFLPNARLRSHARENPGVRFPPRGGWAKWGMTGPPKTIWMDWYFIPEGVTLTSLQPESYVPQLS